MSDHDDRVEKLQRAASRLRRANIALNELFRGSRASYPSDRLPTRSQLKSFDERVAAIKASPKYESTLKRFRDAVQGVYGDFSATEAGLRRGDSRAVEEAIVFLEADPWCFRSGYTKQDFMRRLRQVPLSDSEKARLRQVMINAVHARPREDFREYCRTAKTLDTPDFEATLTLIREDEGLHAGVRRRASWMLQHLEHGRRQSGS